LLSWRRVRSVERGQHFHDEVSAWFECDSHIGVSAYMPVPKKTGLDERPVPNVTKFDCFTGDSDE
jgi:hypothetical protein